MCRVSKDSLTRSKERNWLMVAMLSDEHSRNEASSHSGREAHG